MNSKILSHREILSVLKTDAMGERMPNNTVELTRKQTGEEMNDCVEDDWSRTGKNEEWNRKVNRSKLRTFVKKVKSHPRLIDAKIYPEECRRSLNNIMHLKLTL